MMRIALAVLLAALSFKASAETVILRCTSISGTYAGQSGYIGFSEEKGVVAMGGGIVPAQFRQHAIEWSSADGEANYKLDRVAGQLFIQVRRAPYTLEANCIVSPDETKF